MTGYIIQDQNKQPMSFSDIFRHIEIDTDGVELIFPHGAFMTFSKEEEAKAMADEFLGEIDYHIVQIDFNEIENVEKLERKAG